MDTRSSSPPAGRPLNIPVFIPHLGCPHECIFCNQRSITGTSACMPSPDQIYREIKRFLKYGRRRPSSIQISFFGGSFLGLGEASIRQLLETVVPFVQDKAVDSIRFSTRPDTVNRETLAWLDGFPVSTVELGVQSMHDRVLAAAGRGHRSADTVHAVRLLKERGYQVGLQMMVGLPEDDEDGAMETGRRIAALRPDFMRIYPTLVLKGSRLAQRFSEGRYHPMGLPACISLVKRLYLLFNDLQIPVVRMGLQASDGLTHAGDLIAGPYHPAFGHLVHAEIVLDSLSAALGRMTDLSDRLTITVNPRMVSRVQGLNKQNLLHLKRVFKLQQIDLLQDAELPPKLLMVAGHRVRLP